MQPDLDAIETLDTVVRSGGFARAGAKLHRAQSALSHRIQKLEHQLGLTLLDRSGYRVRLTPAGEVVLAEGRRLLAEAQRLGSLARQLAVGWEARLLVIVDGILPAHSTLQALKTMADERVPTRIQVKVEFLHGVQYRFEKDDADLMLVKDYQPGDHLHVDPLPEIESILCVAPGHPLAGRRRLSLADLQEHVELSIQDSSERGDDRHMFGGERVFFLSDFMTKKDALRLGLGFGWMPSYLVESELRQRKLVELHYAGGSRYRFTPALVSRRDRPIGRAAARLSELLLAGAGEATPRGRARARRVKALR